MADTLGSDDNEIPRIEPDVEPEYVGAHSSIVAEKCENWKGDSLDVVHQCGSEATHTVVMWTGSMLVSIAMCDDCGEPDDVNADREWSGEPVEAER